MISNCHLNRLNLGHRFLALIFLAGAVNVENVVESGDIYRLPVSNAIQVFALIAGGLKKSSDIGLDTTLWFLYVVSLKHNEYHCITLSYRCRILKNTKLALRARTQVRLRLYLWHFIRFGSKLRVGQVDSPIF